MLHTPVRLLSVLIALAVALPVLQGCGEQKKKSEIRAEEGTANIADLLATRRARIVKQLPTSDDPGDEEHPWLAWIKRSVTTTPSNDLRKIAIKAKKTAAADQAETLAKYFEAQREYMLNEKIAPNDYMREMAPARRDAQGQPWAVDLEFDAIFFHAAEQARTYTLFAWDPHDERVIRFFTYWKYVFDFVPRTSIFEDEVNRLCDEKLNGYCKTIPMEERPFQVMRPYYEGTIAKIAGYKAKFPNSPYNPLLDRIAAHYKIRIEKVPKFEEFPVLPAIRSTMAAPLGGNAVMWVTDRGITLMDNELRKPGVAPVVADKPAGAPWKADWLPDEGLTAQISALVQDVRSSTISQYNQSPIFIVPAPDVPVGYLEPLLRAAVVGPNAKEWPQQILVGRRRSDGSNRRAGFTISVLAADKAVPFKLKPIGAKKALTCTAWAVVGKDPFEAKGFKPVVWHDGDKVTTARLADDGTLNDAQTAPGHGDGDRLETWADQQTASMVVAVSAKAGYAKLLEALNGVAVKCGEEEGCRIPRTSPIFIATCR